MKKIVLTLGILLGTVSTYAVNTNSQINIEKEDNCQKIVYHYNEDGSLSYVSVHLC